jgi:hypothetical protein
LDTKVLRAPSRNQGPPCDLKISSMMGWSVGR